MTNGLISEEDFEDFQTFSENNLESIKVVGYTMAMVEAHAKFAIRWLKESLPEVQEWLTPNNSTEASIWIIVWSIKCRAEWGNCVPRGPVIIDSPSSCGNRHSHAKRTARIFLRQQVLFLRMLLSSMITKPSNKNLVLISCSLRTTVVSIIS